MGKGSSGLSGTSSASGGTDAISNLSSIDINDRIKNTPKFQESLKIINELVGEYNTRLGVIAYGAEKAAGDVDMSGYRMRINNGQPDVAIHEFAHTMANKDADKYGLTKNNAFWKEVQKVKNEYHRDVDKTQDSKRWISGYEHSSRSIDEFFAEAFTHAKMKQMGISKPSKYGNDYTYSDKVLSIVDKYFKRR